MAVTYADLVAFGFAYVENNISANVKKQRLSVKKATIPLLSSEDTCLCKDEDFIVFAEFSEVKGPMALFTLPSYIQDDEKIDVNSFIMRIMSVDYQANLGGQFCICQDTQILQTYVSHGRHAYVHYFTLYDIHARGFVRPLCVAYVSSNHNKLHRMFPQLREQFLKVTELIKVNNRQNFKNEISSVLLSMKDILNNGEILIKEQEDSEPASNSSKPHIQREQQSEDFSFMLRAVEASLIGVEYTLATLDHWHSALTFRDEAPVPKELEGYLTLVSSPPYRKPLNFNDGVCVLKKQLRPIPVLCPWGTACALSQLICILQNFGSCELSASIGCFPAISSTQAQKGPLTAWEALGKTEFLQLLQSIVAGALDASIPSIDEQECEGYSCKEEISGNEGSSSYHSLSDSNCGSLNKTLSVTGPSSSTAPIDSSCESLIRGFQGGMFHGSFHTINDDSISPSHAESSEDYHSVVANGPLPQISINSDIIDKVLQRSNPHPGNELETSDSSSTDSESFHDILEALHSDDNWSVGSTDELCPLGSVWSHCLWTRYKPLNKSGHRILKFFWTYRSAAQHVLYSLLTGRTLVLTGDASSEQRVFRIINALSPLIPPLDKNGLRVLRWHQGILVSAHIASYQLIGMCIPERLSIHDMISPRDKNSVTILDVNSEQLLGPAYRGHLLASVGNNVRDFPGDHCLLLYLDSVLSGIGRKLQAYKALVAACNQELPSHACRQLDLNGCDADIIRYLSKLSL